MYGDGRRRFAAAESCGRKGTRGVENLSAPAVPNGPVDEPSKEEEGDGGTRRGKLRLTERVARSWGHRWSSRIWSLSARRPCQAPARDARASVRTNIAPR